MEAEKRLGLLARKTRSDITDTEDKTDTKSESLEKENRYSVSDMDSTQKTITRNDMANSVALFEEASTSQV